jgi:phenylacetate-CoA ligase
MTVTYVAPGMGAMRDAAVFAEIERAPRQAVRALQEERLCAQLAYLRARSVFYQKKLAAAGVDWSRIRRIEDLSLVPFTVKQDLRDSLKAAPPFGEHLAADPADIIQMQASSGTTGDPAYVALTAADVVQWNESSARSLFACGIRPGERVLHALSLSKGFVGGLPVFQAIQYMGALDVPIGADGGADRLLVACRCLRPQAIVATPNFVAYLGQIAPEILGIPARELGVKRLVVGGEPGGGIPALRQQIDDLWGATTTEMMGGTDLGVMYWAECHLRRGMHMVAPDYVLAELIDPETGEVREFTPGGAGELVYTALGRQASPVLRFRSGDHVSVLDCECPCGRTGALIRCVGRTDDMLIVRGVNVFPSAILDVVGELRPAVSGTMRVLADFPGHSTQRNLKLLVERGAGAPASADAGLTQEIERRVRNRLSVKAEVEIVAHETFERPGARKLSITLRQRPSGLPPAPSAVPSPSDSDSQRRSHVDRLR